MNRMNTALGLCVSLGAQLWAAGAYAQAAKKTTEGTVFFSGEIVSALTTKCLDVTDRSRDDGAAVQQWTCAREPNQLWNIVDQGRSEYSIVSQWSKKALDVAGATDQDGANVVQNAFQDFDNQRWRLQRTPNGTYQIVNARTKKCLDLQEGKRDEGAKVQQWSCSGEANQTWLLRK